MNQVIVTGLLKGTPTEGAEFFGQRMYWFSLKVYDSIGKKGEIVEVAGTESMKNILNCAVSQNTQVIVQGAIHTCDGTDLDQPGKHRFILAEQIAPFSAAVHTAT